MKRIISFITLLAVSAVMLNFSVIQAADKDEKILIAYFSRMENTAGDTSGLDADATSSASLISNANTEILAQYIKEQTNGDMFSILTEEVYSSNYDECLSRAQLENSENARPALKSVPQNMESYDTIFIGFPDWCGTCPMAVFTFLEGFDTSGKKIIPFCAHGTSGLGTSVDDIKAACPNAAVETAFGVYRDDVADCKSDVLSWLSELGYGEVSVNDAEMTLTENMVTIKAVKEINNAVLILAGYENGKLINVNTKKVSTDTDLEIKENVSGFDNADMVKAYLWTSLEGIVPLCASKEINISKSDKVSNSLTVYFSRVGNTDYDDDVDATSSASVAVNNKGNLTGTTESVAKLVNAAVGGDIIQIQTAEKYTTDFDELVDKNHDEINTDYIPALIPMDIDISEYDTIFIGYPIWATTIPQAVRAFMREYDLTGKTVVPFCTHAGYGSGKSYSEIKKECPNSTVLDGLAIQADDIVGKDLIAVNESVVKWLTENGIETSKRSETPIKITIGNRVLDGYLNDTPEAEQFKAMLPITVNMVGYGGREYYGGISNRIEDSTEGKLNFEDGDITYCPTNNTVAIFYAQTSRPNLTMQVISMGKVTSALSVFDELDSSEDITFSLSE
jgi:flavodoxin